MPVRQNKITSHLLKFVKRKLIVPSSYHVYFIISFAIFVAFQTSAPSSPPVEVTGVALSSHSLRISWEPPPIKTRNGKITFYKVLYLESMKPTDPSMATVKTVDGSKNQVTLNNLNTWTEYRVWVLAGTEKGEGPLSEAILLKTDEGGKI